MGRVTGYVLGTLLLVLGLGGCGTGPPIRYYTLQLPVTPDPAANLHAPSLVVGRISAPAILQNGPIAYRVGQHGIGTYEYHRWEEPPVEMLKLSLMRALRSSGEYSSVSSLGSQSEGAFLVRGRLYNFEEVDTPSTISALVSMEFDLVDRKNGRVVWSHFYSQSEPVEGKKIPEVVAALNRSFDRGLKQVTSGIGEYFFRNLAKTVDTR